jgi:ABC-type nitrate/sulfonate/bicarbonate transport system substrate-binding protein
LRPLIFQTVVSLIFALVAGNSFAADKIRISYSGPSVSNALLWVTQEGKLFEKNGLDVEVVYLAGSFGQSALLAKNADAKNYIDTRFIEELDRSGYIDALYK